MGRIRKSGQYKDGLYTKTRRSRSMIDLIEMGKRQEETEKKAAEYWRSLEWLDNLEKEISKPGFAEELFEIERESIEEFEKKDERIAVLKQVHLFATEEEIQAATHEINDLQVAIQRCRRFFEEGDPQAIWEAFQAGMLRERLSFRLNSYHSKNLRKMRKGGSEGAGKNRGRTDHYEKIRAAFKEETIKNPKLSDSAVHKILERKLGYSESTIKRARGKKK